jgi:hypothetical protein
MEKTVALGNLKSSTIIFKDKRYRVERAWVLRRLHQVLWHWLIELLNKNIYPDSPLKRALVVPLHSEGHEHVTSLLPLQQAFTESPKSLKILKTRAETGYRKGSSCTPNDVQNCSEHSLRLA